jgi:hypothetical protein
MPATTYFKHVAHHLLEIALAVLPQSHGSDSDSEGDSASSTMSDVQLLHVPGIEKHSLSPARSLESIQDAKLEPSETTTMDVVAGLWKPKTEPLISRLPAQVSDATETVPIVPEKDALQKKGSTLDQVVTPGVKLIPVSSQTKTPVAKTPYKVGKILGAGSYSVVKECVNTETGTYYAAKVINKRLMAGQEHRVSFFHVAPI